MWLTRIHHRSHSSSISLGRLRYILPLADVEPMLVLLAHGYRLFRPTAHEQHEQPVALCLLNLSGCRRGRAEHRAVVDLFLLFDRRGGVESSVGSSLILRRLGIEIRRQLS
jgi:hypothetical protein